MSLCTFAERSTLIGVSVLGGDFLEASIALSEPQEQSLQLVGRIKSSNVRQVSVLLTNI